MMEKDYFKQKLQVWPQILFKRDVSLFDLPTPGLCIL